MALEGYIAGYRRHRLELIEAWEKDRLDLLQKVRGLAPYFDGLPGLRRVLVFGSAARPGGFGPDSDVDFAFEGLSPGLFCEILSRLVERLERDVDGVRLEDAEGLLRERVMKGTVVYERGPSQAP
jgi:predicted nucleotidyltransferase